MDIVIETPKGNGNKYNYNPKTGFFELGKRLPEGLAFPFDFGFIPGTLGEDGDPLDVVSISDFAVLQGCAVPSRIIGCMHAHQHKQGERPVRNDRYIAIPDACLLYSKIKTAGQLPFSIKKQLESFFINYNKQEDKSFKVLKWISAKHANATVENARNKPAKKDQLVQLLLPLTKGNGVQVPSKYFDGIRRDLTRKFGGMTEYGRTPASGIWKDHNDKLKKDSIIVYEVMVDRIDPSYWKGVRKKLEKQFGQEQIIIRRNDIGLL